MKVINKLSPVYDKDIFDKTNLYDNEIKYALSEMRKRATENVVTQFMNKFGNRYVSSKIFRDECNIKNLQFIYTSSEYIGAYTKINIINMKENNIGIQEDIRKIKCCMTDDEIEKRDRFQARKENEEKKNREIVNIKYNNKGKSEKTKKILVLCANNMSIATEKWKRAFDPSENTDEIEPYFFGVDLSENLEPYLVKGELKNIGKYYSAGFDYILNEHCPYSIYDRENTSIIYDLLDDNGIFMGADYSNELTKNYVDIIESFFRRVPGVHGHFVKYIKI